jgi:bifunctional UDP-N-acetylglucosamine pyrophosphorylase/glucosamine-1-phosphate N-acetyltransferase
VGNNTEILQSSILKGKITIGHNCRIETPVRLTGSDDFPVRIGNNVRIKGTTYIFGSVVENNTYIENCVLFKKKIKLKKDSSGRPLRIRNIFPEPQGSECLKDL